MNTALPFYPIFNALRQGGFPMGIEEYKAFVEVLLGYGQYEPQAQVMTKEDLYEICKTLWLKPNQVPLNFETVFNEQYDRLVDLASQGGAEQERQDEGKPSKEAEAAANERSPSEIRDRIEQLQNVEKNRNLGDIVEDSNSKGVRVVLGGGFGEHQSYKKERAAETERRFLFTDNYFPVSRREVQQLFSYLPEKKQQKAQQEIDIDATINSIAGNGYLIEVVYKKDEEILNNLIVLHDHKGSMVAFEKLSDILSAAGHALFRNSQKGNKLTTDFYFQNSIDQFVYIDKSSTSFQTMDAFVELFREKKVMIIIMSDGGAARGSNSDARVRAGIRMLRKLQQITPKIVWLNPMPQGRWVGTAAERLANFVPMFPVTRAGLHEAVEVLRGKQSKMVS
jgi:uncharacterized protein